LLSNPTTDDIEGAEYQVLSAMLNAKTMHYIDERYIKFDGDKLTYFDIEIPSNIVVELKQLRPIKFHRAF